jgi:predicted NUDIX family phosphoesterase
MAQINQQISQQPVAPKQDELILVVPRSELFKQTPAWSGLKQVKFDEYVAIINEKKQFLPRSLMEQDPHYKQIIPYLIFQHADRYFLMQRTAQTTEQRLKNKYSLGIGGHIRQEDMAENSIFEWAKREFHEEVNYSDSFTITPLGILNDDATPVGQVHIGFVLLVTGSTDKISVNSELKSGQLVTLDELGTYFANLESWSQLVFEFLKNQ